MTESPSTVKRRRIEAIDIARGVALIAMAIYHFTWDLEFFGYAERGLTTVGGWKIFARSIASSFLFLVGVSLFLAHARGVRWPSFWQRWLMVAAAAAAISAATWYFTPNAFIFFGILHEIAAASLLGLFFLRLPAVLTLVVAVAVIAAPFLLRTGALDAPWWWWTGLQAEMVRSNDYVPLFPWFGAVLLGIVAAKLGEVLGLFDRLRDWTPGRWSRPLTFIGRHSLAFYLIHQPVLISLVWLFAQFAPPQTETPQVQFRDYCETDCGKVRDAEFCARYCVCMLDGIETANALDRVMRGVQTPQLTSALATITEQCTIDSEAGVLDPEEAPQ